MNECTLPSVFDHVLNHKFAQRLHNGIRPVEAIALSILISSHYTCLHLQETTNTHVSRFLLLKREEHIDC